jgi:hypothetical protein
VSHHVSDHTITTWFNNAVARGQVVVIEIHESATPHNHETSKLSKVVIPTGGLNDGVPKRRMTIRTLSDLSVESKLMEVLLRTIGKLPRETQEVFKQMISPQALSLMAGIFAAWVVSHAFGLGEAIDAILLGIGYAFIGMSAIGGVELIYEGAKATLSAKNEGELDVAADKLARGVTILGVNTLLVLLTHKKAGGTAVQSEAAVLTQWEYYIGNLKLPFDGSRAALWSRLGDKGARAASEASKEGLVTLEQLLEKSGFMDRYRAQFGEDAKTDTTGQIWEWISEKYALQLKGTVVVYTNKLDLIASKARMPYEEPQLGAELFKILERPMVDRVIFRDVDNPNRSTIWSRADMARFRQFEKQGGGI